MRWKNYIYCALLGMVGGPASAAEIPSLQDEIDAYALRGITYPSGLESDPSIPANYTEAVNSEKDIHGVTEGDELWIGYANFLRRGQTPWRQHAAAWRQYYEAYYVGSDYWNENRSVSGSTAKVEQEGNSLDHLYGWGLIDWYENEGDAQALAIAERITKAAKAEWDGDQGSKLNSEYAVTSRNARRVARQLHVAVRTAQYSSDPEVIAHRDNLLDTLRVTPSWNANQGMYFLDRTKTDDRWGAGAYDAGQRGIQSFHIGMLFEALWQGYQTTGQDWIKQRIVDMAYWVQKYGYDPNTGMTMTNMGSLDGNPNHSGNVVPDGVMTISQVNGLVYGYKLTGDETLLDRAWFHFMRWQEWRGAAPGTLDHFVDTKFATGGRHLRYNMGELQYCYRLFENGGQPIVVGNDPRIRPKPPQNLETN